MVLFAGLGGVGFRCRVSGSTSPGRSAGMGGRSGLGGRTGGAGDESSALARGGFAMRDGGGGVLDNSDGAQGCGRALFRVVVVVVVFLTAGVVP